MKKFTFLTFLSIAFVSGMILMSSCTKEGPAGATGAQGATGAAGVAGEDGINGTDGTAGCIACHDGGESQGMFSQINQWEASTHATGGNFNRNDEDCAICHTSQGFLGNLSGSYDPLAEGAIISNPNPINCYTCHNIHDTYTSSDLALTTTSAVTLHINGAQVDLGKGNLCANCHQNRLPEPMPVLGGSDVFIPHKYWGAHYGAQAAVMAGTGGFEFGTGYLNSAHGTQIENTCVDCHMAEADGVAMGGHTMGITKTSYGSTSVNSAGCVACHPDSGALNAKMATTATEIDGLEAQLKALLMDAGVLDATSHAIPQTMSATHAAAIINLNLAHYDGSHGAHNYLYIKTLLTNTIAEVTP